MERVHEELIVAMTKQLFSLMLLFLLVGATGCNQPKATPTYEDDFLALANTLDRDLEMLEPPEEPEKLLDPKDQQAIEEIRKSHPVDYEPLYSISIENMLQSIKNSNFKKDWESQNSTESYKKLCAVLEQIEKDFIGLKSNDDAKRSAAVGEARSGLRDAMLALRIEDGSVPPPGHKFVDGVLKTFDKNGNAVWSVSILDQKGKEQWFTFAAGRQPFIGKTPTSSDFGRSKVRITLKDDSVVEISFLD